MSRLGSSIAALAFTTVFTACQTAPVDEPTAPPPKTASFVHVDQVDYLAQLKALRPDLIAEDCKNNLLLRVTYRPAVLGGFDSFAQIEQREYSAKLRHADEAWAQTFRAAADQQRRAMDAALINAGFDPTADHQHDAPYWDFLATLPFYVAAYDSTKYVGYHVGAPTYYDANGLSPKVYLTLRSAVTDLTPDTYEQFTGALAKANFAGDTKVQLAPGAARFQFNTIIVHAVSVAAALTAERVAQDFFGAKLEAIGRGFDVADDRSGKNAKDWSHYLCEVGASQLSADVLAFAASAGDGAGISITPPATDDVQSEMDEL